MPNEHEFTRGVNPLVGDNDQLWSARDEQSSEDEVNQFLYALVRLIKPKFIVETGAYLGDGTIAMARALKENGQGQILTCDIDADRVKLVDKTIGDLKLEAWARVWQCTGMELIKAVGGTADFYFIDSSPDGKVRLAEAMEAFAYLKSGGLLALHDTAPQHPTIAQAAAQLAWQYRHIYFNCPRGLTLFQKTGD